MRKLVFPAVAALALSAMTLSGCGSKPQTEQERAEAQPDATFKEVKINELYSMSLPDYLTPGTDLNDEASLQYQNIYKEMYIIVIDESKQEFIDVFKELGEYDSTKSACDNYAEAQMKSIEENMEKVTSKSKLRTAKLNGSEARIADVTGKQAGIEDEMAFTVAFVEGKETLYMIMTWTFATSKDKYQGDMDKMINSFKEL